MVGAFNFHSDIKVELSTPPTNAFIIGISEIGGSNVLSGSTYSYTDITSLCTEINITNSVDFISALGKPSESNISITVVGNTYDPRVNKTVLPGTPIKISARTWAGAIGTWKIVHHGRIRDITSVYNPELKDQPEKNMVQFNLDSPMSIASQSALTDADFLDGQWATARMAALCANAASNNPKFPSFATYNDGGGYIGDVKMGDRIIYGETFGSAFLECFDLVPYWGWLALDNQTSNPNGVLVYKTKNVDTPGGTQFLPLDNANTPFTIQINNIDLSSSTDDITNAWNVSPTWDSTDVYAYIDQDSIDLYGQKTLDIALNYSITEPLFNQNWAYSLTDIDLIRSVSVSPINYDDGYLNNTAFVQAGLSYATLYFEDTDILIDDKYMISRVSHTITPEYWNTDLELIGATWLA
jgi:hypothetical protein